MSGGGFDYNQYRIQEISDSIKDIIKESEKQTSQKGPDKEEDDDYINHYHFSPDIIQHMRDAVYVLEKAYIYAQRVDWLISADDDEDSFRERLKEELDALDKSTENGSILEHRAY